MLDVFRNDAFSVVSLTAKILKLPHKPSRLGELGLFNSEGITTATAVVESLDGVLTLIKATERGAPASSIAGEKRTARSFVVPHLERESIVKAGDVQDVRTFGSDNAVDAVQAVVDQRLARLRPMHEVTLEYHRIGAVKGIILDADGITELFDLYDEFGVQRQEYLIGEAGDVRNDAVAIQRLIDDELGAEPVSGYRAFCGDDFFDMFVKSAEVKESLKYQESVQLRRDLRKGFEYGGITWENYSGKVGAIDFIPSDEAYVVPEGTSIFQTYFAPADFLETVNTIGLPLYAKIGEGELNRWAKVHTQSNPLCLNTRPRAVVRVGIYS